MMYYRTLLFEFDHGRGTGYDGLALACFDLEWLTDGGDTPRVGR